MCKVIEDMRREEREEGIKEGIRQGIQQGIREGMKESTKTTVLRMLADGTLALEKIAEFVGLSLDEVKELKTEQGT